MGLFTKMFEQAQAEAEKMMQQKLGGGGSSSFSSSSSATPPTRWEKAIVAMNGIVAQVATIDPDGVDVVCFGGTSTTSSEFFRNIKDTKGLEGMVTAQEPSGECHMGAAMTQVLSEAFERGFSERPCSILVLTAGKPDDADALTKAIQEAAQNVATLPPLPNPDTKAKKKTLSPLTITFVQVGDDDDAETYLKHLDDNLTTTADDGTTIIDIVDTIKDEEIQTAMRELQGGSGKAGTTGGALLGAFAGAAMGVGGMYMYNKLNAKKRTEGWNGNWKATYDGEEVALLKVVDDLNGNLQIAGFPSDGDEPAKTTGSYAAVSGEGDDNNDGFSIQFAEVATGDAIFGTIEDEHSIAWSDGTHWTEVKPDGTTDWKVYMGVAAAGATAAGATGSLLGKKFFDKASHKVPSDYVILLDRSAMMAIPDTGK